MNQLQVTDKAGDEQFKQFVEQVTRLTQSTLAPNAENNLEEVIQKLATDTVAQYESSEIEEQKKVKSTFISNKITCE